MKMNQHIPERNILDLRSTPKTANSVHSSHAHTSQKPSQPQVSFLVEQSPFVHPKESQHFFKNRKTPKAQNFFSFLHKIKKRKEKLKPVQCVVKKDKVFSRAFTLWRITGFGVVAFVIAAVVFGFQAWGQATETKGRVLGAATEGFSSLQDAKSSLLVNDQENAQISLEQAAEHFSYAQNQLDAVRSQFGLLVSLPVIKGTFETGEHAIQVGNEVSHLGLLVQKLIHTTTSEDSNGYVGFMNSYQIIAPEIRSSIETLSYHLDAMSVEKLPTSYQGQFTTLQATFSDLNDAFFRLDKDFSVLYDVLGFSGQKNYLLIFQNNQELRPTGGFIGSVALVGFDHGTISQLTVPKGGSYDISGQVKEKFKAPKPLQVVNQYFSFQDANWFPDFPASAQKILELYYDAGNERVDGVIAFTPDVLLSLLELTGPIDLQTTSGVIVDKDNFLRVTRESIEEQKEQQSTEPKKIIADIMPKLLEKAVGLSMEKQLQFITILDSSIQQKDFLMYTEDQLLQHKVVEAGFSGSLAQFSSDDYLALVTTNIGGGKTDRVINQHILLSTELTESVVNDSVQIIRQHEGVNVDVFSGTTNLSYMRAYVPSGATLEDAINFYPLPSTWYQSPPQDTPVDPDLQEAEDNTIVQERTGTRITSEFQHAVFGNWIRVEAQSSSESTFVYSFPRTTQDDVWTLGVARQPGQHNVSVTWVLDADQDIDHIVSDVPVVSIIQGAHAEISWDLTADTFIGVVFR
ncbi:MAG: DUF4012 domain-containing protein [Patescibacteria group bacterium]|jgi:hypothetical protein